MYRKGKFKPLTSFLIISLFIVACDSKQTNPIHEKENDIVTERNDGVMSTVSFPKELEQIPAHYFQESIHQGTLEEINYDTYESMTYENHQQVLHKRAIVYVPYGYSNEKTYNVFYLIPAVEGTYHTYAKDTTSQDIENSRNHRAFAGFLMGSVATWRTFQYCLDQFRYFMPSSGNLTSDGDFMASMVKDSGHTWQDFFIFAASGTSDFAYSSFKQQIEAIKRWDIPLC